MLMEIYRKWITGCFWNQIRGLTGKGQKGTLGGDENTPYTDGVCTTWCVHLSKLVQLYI